MPFQKSFTSKKSPNINLTILGLPKSGKKSTLRRLTYYSNLDLSTKFKDAYFAFLTTFFGEDHKQPWLEGNTWLEDKNSLLYKKLYENLKELESEIGGFDSNEMNEPVYRYKYLIDTNYYKALKTEQSVTLSPGNNKTSPVHVAADNSPAKSSKNISLKIEIKPAPEFSVAQPAELDFTKFNFSKFNGIIFTIDMSNDNIFKIENALIRVLEFLNSGSKVKESLENSKNETFESKLSLSAKTSSDSDIVINQNQMNSISKFTAPNDIDIDIDIEANLENHENDSNPTKPILLLGTNIDKNHAGNRRELYTLLKLDKLQKKYPKNPMKIFTTSNLFSKIDIGLDMGFGWLLEEVLKGQ